jgi:hypothetical protein
LIGEIMKPAAASKPGEPAPAQKPTETDDDREWAKALWDEGVPAAESADGHATGRGPAAEEPTPDPDKAEPEAGKETGEPDAESEKEPAEEDPAPESEDGHGAGQEEAEDGKDKDPDRKKLSPELQKVFDKRIGELTGKTKRAEEALEHERTRATELDARVKEQEQELLDLRKGGAAQAAGVPKVFLAASEEELQAREDYLWGVEQFCRRHESGYEGDGTETNPSVSADEIRERLLAVQEERQRYLPKARDMVRERQKLAVTVKTVYPELLDPKSEDHKQMEKILRAYPAMRTRPDVELLVGDLLAGKRAREAKAAGKKPAPRPAPSVPMGATPAGTKGGPMDKGKPKTEGRAERFAQGGHTDEALAEALN